MGDRVQDVEIGGAIERTAAGEKLVQHNAKREHVTSCVDRPASRLLG